MLGSATASGRMADHDDGRGPARTLRPDRAGGLAALPLGGACAAATRCAISAARWVAHGSPPCRATWASGIFDGANLVSNFESLNPANTLLGEAATTSIPRSTPRRRATSTSRPGGAARVLLNAGRDAVDRRQPVRRQQADLRRDPHHRAASRVDPRNVRSPIIVLCSRGDNITPAAAWTWAGSLDLYEPRMTSLIENGQTIVYTPAPEDRPSRHLRGGQGRDQGATAEFASCMEHGSICCHRASTRPSITEVHARRRPIPT